MLTNFLKSGNYIKIFVPKIHQMIEQLRKGQPEKVNRTSPPQIYDKIRLPIISRKNCNYNFDYIHYFGIAIIKLN